EIELKDTKLNLQNNFYILKNNIVDLEELVAVREKYLKALETQAEIVSIKYTNGIANYYDWYQTEESYINMQKNLLNLKEELMSKKIELKKFLGDTE
ncbi:MAG: TolC family protein, partial [Candidatus Anstonellales archaeon]